ncbi:MAG: RnfABCDGE type electron transport complex subunit G [Gammaproteobacteria bacterium]|nr:RnfABCDGE type electron transport complex subunit G [Gammaproteobacteria bacterium]
MSSAILRLHQGANQLRQHVSYPALLLALMSALCASLLHGTNIATAPLIAAAERHDRLTAIAAVMPADRYDSDPLANCQPASGPNAIELCPLTLKGQAAGYIATLSNGGYGGPIRMLLGVDSSGTITGVRVLSHTETPGLGDLIEAAKSSWIDSFKGHSLTNTSQQQWAVRKDGGDFDQFTGATITPRAVVGGVHQALLTIQQADAAITPGTTTDTPINNSSATGAGEP